MFEGLTIFLILVGACLIAYSLFHEKNYLQKKISDHHEKSFNDYETYSLRIEELNTKILEVNEFSEYITSEIEKKHQELLFLYQLIQEKSKNIKNVNQIISPDIQEEIIMVDKKDELRPIEVASNNKISKNKMILQLSDQGYEIREIAQMLDIGLGEVKLVLHLYE